MASDVVINVGTGPRESFPKKSGPVNGPVDKYFIFMASGRGLTYRDPVLPYIP